MDRAWRCALAAVLIAQPLSAAFAAETGCQARAPSPMPGDLPPPPVIYDPFALFFDWDSTNLTPELVRLLDNIAAAEALAPGCVILIAGHADASGPSRYNAALAARRAKVVADALRRRGVRARMRITSYGEDRPILRTQDNVREPQNRRVDVGLLPPWKVERMLGGQ